MKLKATYFLTCTYLQHLRNNLFRNELLNIYNVTKTGHLGKIEENN